jgi:hypothetical protein
MLLPIDLRNGFAVFVVPADAGSSIFHRISRAQCSTPISSTVSPEKSQLYRVVGSTGQYLPSVRLRQRSSQELSYEN